MSFQVNFGNQFSQHEDANCSGSSEASRGQRGQPYRGRGRGDWRHTERRPRRQQGSRFSGDANRNEDDKGSEDSDGASSVASENQRRQRGRGGRYRGQERRGKGQRGRYTQKGDTGADQLSCSDQRAPSGEKGPEPALQFSEDSDGSEESSGAHTVTTGNQRKQRGRGGRYRGQERRGRGQRGRYTQKGDTGGQQFKGSWSDLRTASGEPISTTAFQVSEDSSGSGDSDGASSVTSENQRGQRGRGGKYRGQERRGKKQRGRYTHKGERSAEQYRGSYSDLRTPPEESRPSTAPQEIHIHYHALPQMGGAPALLLHQNMAPNPMGSKPHVTGYPSDPHQVIPALSTVVSTNAPGNSQQSYSLDNIQFSQQAYLPDQHPHPSQPMFSMSGLPPAGKPGLKSPLLPDPPSVNSPGNRMKAAESVSQPTLQGQTSEQQFQAPLRSDRPTRGNSSQNLNQTFSDIRNDQDVRPKQKEGTKGHPSQKPVNKDVEQPNQKSCNENKQQPLSNSDDKPATPDVGPDEWIKVFNFLLKQFMGRTKMGTLLCKKGDLLKGLSHSQIATWLKQSEHFLCFERNEQVKFVSVKSKVVRMCYKYKKHGTDKCGNENCPFFHICRDFVSGDCPRQSSCHFNHSFHTKSNAKVCAEAGLQAFTDEEIRIILTRSTLVVCDKFNKGGGCQGDCPDIHICAQFIRNSCTDESCKMGHQIKGSEHNNWVLETFHMQKISEPVLCQMVIVMKENCTPNSGAGKPATSAPDLGNQRQKPQVLKTFQHESQPMNRHQSRENITDTSEWSQPTSTEQRASFPVENDQQQQQHQESKRRRERKEKSSSKPRSPADTSTAAGVEKGVPRPQQQIRRNAPDKEDGQDLHAHTPLTQTGMKAAANPEGQEEQRALPASHYTHLCEHHTWTEACQKGYLCPRYHHRDKPPFIWQLHAGGDWLDLSEVDSMNIEQHFCGLESQVRLEVLLGKLSGMQLSVDFDTMTAKEDDSSFSMLAPGQTLKVRRWSTPSYVESEDTVPFFFYTQWTWYYLGQRGNYQPFIPGTLQYTLEEKYLSKQQKYYFESEEGRFLLCLQEMKLEILGQDVILPVLRRPYLSAPDAGSTPALSNLLVSEPPEINWSSLPRHWARVDHYQDFEMVEMEKCGSEYQDVERSFHSTLSQDRATVLRVFRVQNPSLWDKYCSTKRAMTPRGGFTEDVDERKLFHGTPTLLSARGICANSMDFRRAGENVGALFGRGSYFSAHALYSHSYTNGPDRYMFLAKVLVGKFTKGCQSYTSPPPREGLKLYDSCVDNESNPTIFVIFDLAQSYPEYLIQYTDAEMEFERNVKSATGPVTALIHGGARAGVQSVLPTTSVPKAFTSQGKTGAAMKFNVEHFSKQGGRGAVGHFDASNSAEDDLQRVEYWVSDSQVSGVAQSARNKMSEYTAPKSRKEYSSQQQEKPRRKASSDKCLIS